LDHGSVGLIASSFLHRGMCDSVGGGISSYLHIKSMGVHGSTLLR
jgi:hypothetical protein